MSSRYHWSDPRHAVWGFAKFVIVSAIVLAVLALNANDFSEDEIEKWVQIVIGVAGLQGGMGLLKHTVEKKEQAQQEDTEK